MIIKGLDNSCRACYNMPECQFLVLLYFLLKVKAFLGIEYNNTKNKNMKAIKVFFWAMLVIMSTQATMAQMINAKGQEEVVYGIVRTDGYNQITKGAFWAERPEAKMIYEGLYPSGYTVFVLEKDSYVRFVNSEHNNFDRNYIVFPKGERVYTDSLGILYSAKCGNRIEYIRPVDMVRVVVEKEFVEKIIPTSSYYTTINYYQQPTLPLPIEVKITKKGWILPVCIVGGVTVTVGVGYLIYSLTRHHDVIEPRTMPPAQQ